MTVNECVVGVHVVPNAKQFQILGFNAWTHALKLKTRNPAHDNKANTELVRELKKFLDAEVEVLSGTQARTKLLKIKGKTLAEVHQAFTDSLDTTKHKPLK